MRSTLLRRRPVDMVIQFGMIVDVELKGTVLAVETRRRVYSAVNRFTEEE